MGRDGAGVHGDDAGAGARGGSQALADPRRRKNIRVGLLLAAVAMVFFSLIVLKLGWYGR